MSIPALPFSPKSGNLAQPDDERRRRLSRALPAQSSGLAALAQGGEEFEDTSVRPQQIGEAADLALKEPEIPKISQAPELEQPSMLATERVERAPATTEARSLLSDEERFGAAVGEAVRGEEPGSPAPGTRGVPSRERREAVERFLRPEANGPDDMREALGIAGTVASTGRNAASGLRALAQPTARERLAGAKAPHGLDSTPTMWTIDAEGNPIPTTDPLQMTPELNRQMDPRLPGDTSGFDFGGAARGTQDSLGGVLGVISLLRAISDLKEGRLPQGGLSALSGAGALMKAASSATAPGGFAAGAVSPGVSSGLGTAGGAIGSLAGLAGAGLSAAEGQWVQAIISALQGGLGAAGVLAPGAMSAAAASAAASAAAGSSAAASGASMAPALAGAAGLMAVPLALPALGALLHPFFDEWDQLSLRERHERRNNDATIRLSDLLGGAIPAADNLGGLLALSGIGPSFGQGQVQFVHDKFGFGGDYDDPMSPEFEGAMQAALNDPKALRDFISGISIKTGPTGQTNLNEAMTDLYRRELARLGGITDGTGLFREWDPRSAAMTGAGNWEQEIPVYGDLLGSGVRQVRLPIGPGTMSDGYSTVPVSRYLRAPGALNVDPAQRAASQERYEALKRDLETQEQIRRENARANGIYL